MDPMKAHQLNTSHNMKTADKHPLDLNEALSRGVQLHQSGQLENAAQIYKAILANDPEHADAMHLLGFVSHQAGDNKTAEELISRAVQHHPETPFFHNSLGIVYESMGQYDKAINCFQIALKIKPDMTEVLNNMGLALMKKGRPEKSLPVFKMALKNDPDNPDILGNLAEACRMLKGFDDAMGLYERAVQLAPDHLQACFGLADIYQKLDKPDDALHMYEKILEIQPNHTEALLNKGIILHMQGRISEAIDCYKQITAADPSDTRAYDNLGKAFQDMGDIEKSLHYYDITLKQEPENADTHFDRSLVLLLMGNLEQGFREYEWRFLKSHWKKTYPYRLNKSRWNGTPFYGKRLFVHAEQGFGDTIQFIRYLPAVKALGGEVIFETQKQLSGLFQDFPGIDCLVAADTAIRPEMNFDGYIPLLSLPCLFRTTLDTIPARIPYLYADPSKVDLWKKHISGPEFKIGLVWAGSPTNNDDRNRSIPLHRFSPLCSIPGVRVYGLQKGRTTDHVLVPSNDVDIINFGNELEDFSDTAGLIENLDLVISVDTATAHLAGAMGKPVWTLLPFAPDWRWLTKRNDTPWYPTMRLFRQPEYGNWKRVIQDVKQALEKQLQHRK